MAHSYVDFQGTLIHLLDSDIFWLMSWMKEESQSTKLPERLLDLFDWWGNDDAKPGPGCIDLRLDEFLTEATDIVCLLDLLNSVEVQLRSYDSLVPGDILNRIVGCVRFQFHDEKMEVMLRVVAEFRSLLENALGRVKE